MSLPESSTPRAANVAVKALPYLIIIVLFFAQGGVVIAIERLCDALHFPQLGPWVSWLVFVIGGYALGLLHLRLVKEGEPLHDPLHVACAWLLRRLHVVGFVLATLMFGSMGASIALKREGYSRRLLYSFISAVIYASVWIPLYTGLFGGVFK
ncbi:MAG TPA: hypothetical protein VLG09_06080 [Candidatus Saccharimonadales bacterium]|nr:hypothetical protein [Candidatus Saccharimonadales bacterium]